VKSLREHLEEYKVEKFRRELEYDRYRREEEHREELGRRVSSRLLL